MSRPLMGTDIVTLRMESVAINRFRDRLIRAAVEGAYEDTIAGHQVLVSNCPYTVGTDVAGILAENRPFAAYWYRKGNVEHWGLRSREGGIDVAKIAETFGGSGHRAASGFRVEIV